MNTYIKHSGGLYRLSMRERSTRKVRNGYYSSDSKQYLSVKEYTAVARSSQGYTATSAL